jgi:hypothetical protein
MYVRYNENPCVHNIELALILMEESFSFYLSAFGDIIKSGAVTWVFPIPILSIVPFASGSEGSNTSITGR